MRGFLYQDSLNPIAELDGSGSVVSRFVYGDRGNVPEYMVKSGVTYRLISDHLGSVRLVVNTETSTVAQRLDYDAFGRTVLDTHPGFQPFGFAGGLYDPLTGFVRFGARDYDPQVGRWTAKDPILFRGRSANLYAYAFVDPVNFADPNGENPLVLALPAAGVAVAADGPLPVGDIIAAGILIGAGIDLIFGDDDAALEPPGAPIPAVGPRDRPVAPGRGCPRPQENYRRPPPPTIDPSDPEDNEPPKEDDLWKNKDQRGFWDKVGDFVDELGEILGGG